MGDLLSLHQHKLPVKIIVFSNSALAFVELEMMAAGILGQGTELVNPDFVAVERLAGMFGMRLRDRVGTEQRLIHKPAKWIVSIEQRLRQSGQKRADLCNDMIYWRHAAHNKRIMQMNTTIKFGLAPLAERLPSCQARLIVPHQTHSPDMASPFLEPTSRTKKASNWPRLLLANRRERRTREACNLEEWAKAHQVMLDRQIAAPREKQS